MKRRTVLAGVPMALAGCLDAFDDPDADAAETAIRESINADREAAGVGELQSSETLKTAARAHSRDMHDRDFYAHTNPDGEGPTQRVGCRAGENIHSGELGRMANPGGSETWNTRQTNDLAGFVAEGWRESQGHYRNMVDAGWQALGVGVYIGDDEFFATVKFC